MQPRTVVDREENVDIESQRCRSVEMALNKSLKIYLRTVLLAVI